MRIPVWVFLFLFTVSGFAGLIYESIWSHYLKLFLGHAAYAQTLVLGIFMGGMALGSWLAGRFAGKIRHALLGYALAELVIGMLALGFHQTFGFVTNWAFDSLIPSLGSPLTIDLAKWSIATLLILPASILLGTTFPLMSTGIMRAYGDSSGRYLPLLYFTNSFGAAIGVLASGFIFIDKVGLPGTIFSAGLFNISLALVVWLISKRITETVPARDTGLGSSVSLLGRQLSRVMLIAAFATGAASFMFEIAWIRMLSMAIGASTHSFEVMLSAFILGIALGGLALGTIGNRFRNYPLLLAIVLSAKVVFALAAVWTYPNLLDLVKWLYGGLARTESGYSLYLLGSYAVSGLMMIPTAFCAGMTLPLATRTLLDNQIGEKAVGQVYAANTLGAIAGTFFATHIGMEALGVQGITAFGAAIELVVVVVILVVVGKVGMRRTGLIVVPCLVLLISFTFFFELDKLKMASGVYRFGQFMSTQSTVEFHRDGKTATISVLRTEKSRDIRTNGKTDAGIRITDREKTSTPDEHTMELAAILPFMFVPDAQIVGNIGFGSGLTTHTVLGNPGVRQVDSIEIEAAMIEGAKLFSPVNDRAYTDPRSKIYVDDAKTFFSARKASYDIIISEPSNPWISGVSTLFSDEFYARIKKHISQQGVLVQWIQLYDTKPYVLASILKALGGQFQDYVIYFAGPGDAMIIASPYRSLPDQLADPFKVKNWTTALNRLGYSRASELQLLRIGSKRALEPMVKSFAVQKNSDYYPVVDLNAPKERFVGSNAIADFAIFGTSFVPFVGMLDQVKLPTLADISAIGDLGLSPEGTPVTLTRALLAHDVARSIERGEMLLGENAPDKLKDSLGMVLIGQKACTATVASAWVNAYEVLMRVLASSLAPADNLRTLLSLKSAECMKWALKQEVLSLRLKLIESIIARDLDAMRSASGTLIARPRLKTELAPEDREAVIQAYLASSLFLGARAEAKTVLDALKDDQLLTKSLLTIALIAHLEQDGK
ncbi:MAG: fused MFS/spermidine synthase [Betaproteobacteria bacterium]|nr:fused MFS/spermidine synthase [Betaproteobacteria bacterium]